ncbi:hypothetical protein [Streptomyces sp. NPDC097610]|uniref:hypothetical protein n=1 Tax=Streptomyces sp. NPDC097610 TaxID=3157227 RepID=UPI003324ABF2
MFPRTDARARSDSTVPPAEQADAAAQTPPEQATDLRYDTARLRPRTETPYGLRLIVNIDPDSRPRPAVLVTLEEA